MDAELSFDDWIAHIFDHDVTDPAWYWDDRANKWNYDECNALALSHLTLLFRGPEVLIGRFSDAQIKQGLWYLVDSSCSSYGKLLNHAEIALRARLECIQSIYDLFISGFSRMCDKSLGHLPSKTSQGTAANAICYMFWDLLPVFGRSRTRAVDPKAILLDWTPDDLRGLLPDEELADVDPELVAMKVWDVFARSGSNADLREIEQRKDELEAIEAACLDVMERLLQISHPAVQESALHGLGHWQEDYPERVEPIIDSFLASGCPSELRQYAMSARAGAVQ